MRKPNSDKPSESKEEDCTSKKVMPPNNAKSVKPLNPIILFVIGTLASVLIAELLPLRSNLDPIPDTIQTNNETISQLTAEATEIVRPTFAIYSRIKRNDDNNLAIVKKTLKLFGYTEVGIDDDWNLLWGFGSPFHEEVHRIVKMKPHQLVNHLPSMDLLSARLTLSTSGLPYIPRAFQMTKHKDDFLNYVDDNPDKLFLVFNGAEDRAPTIKKPKNVNIDSNATFVQEFIKNPYLVDGYKFVIGIYTVITSINPVRLYVYTGDAMIRYCQEKFYPFNPKSHEKYIIDGFRYRPTWKVPALKKYFKLYGGGMRASFDAYVRDQGHDPSEIWDQAEEVIRHTVVAQATEMAARSKYFHVPNFFELIRVDLQVDDDFNVYLNELVMSPNMNSHTMKRNRVVFKQVLYNALQLVGVGSPIKGRNYLEDFDAKITAVIDDKNVASNINECVENNCHKDCGNEAKCSLCITCLNEEDYMHLARAHREHIHRADMKRIFPKPILDVENFDLEEESGNLTEINKWMTKWFYHKCLYDRSWC